MRKLLLIIGALLMMLPVLGQHQQNDKKSRKEMHREMREFKIKFLAQEMGLTPDQTTKFSELYKKMDIERKQLFHQCRNLEKKLKESGKVSNEEYEDALKCLSEARARDLEIEKRYDAEFSKFLSARQIFKLKSSEAEFRQRMFRMHNKRKKE